MSSKSSCRISLCPHSPIPPCIDVGAALSAKKCDIRQKAPGNHLVPGGFYYLRVECSIWFFIASKLSLLSTCSRRQASSDAISGATPSWISIWERTRWRSKTDSAMWRPVSVSEIWPAWSTVICPLVRRFFIATLTLGLEKFSSLATSIERT